MNDLILRAARGEVTERVPVWLMRQAGRILPGYRKLRADVKDFSVLLKNPELSCQITIEPVDLLGVDAAIIFSDILVVSEALGFPFRFAENKGPFLEKNITSVSDVNTIKSVDSGDWNFVLDAIRLTKKELTNRVPLIGFAGSPWTLFAYMTEGTSSKIFSQAKKIIYSKPSFAFKLLEKITSATIKYLTDQVDAGADMIQIFDSCGGVLGPTAFKEFSLDYIIKICDAMSKRVPVIVFSKGTFFANEKLNRLNCRVISLDWTVSPALARQKLNSKTLQGNLDPCILYAGKEVIKKEVNSMIDAFGKRAYIANLGDGVYPDIQEDNVRHFVDCVKEYSH